VSGEVADLKIRAARQSVLAELGLLALGKIDLQRLLDQAVERIRDVLGTDTCAVMELLPGGQSLRAAADTGWRERISPHLVVSAAATTLAGFTLLMNAPVVVVDTHTEERFEIPFIFTKHGVRSSVTVIIHGRERPYGIFGVQTRALREFTKEDVDYLQAAANVLGSAIERIRAEEDLARSERSFRSVIEHAPEAVAIGQRTLVYVNRAYCALLGYERPEDLLGKGVAETMHPDDVAASARRLQAMGSTGKSASTPIEVRLRRKDGSSVLVESVSVPIVFDGKPAIAAMLRDISERKKMEARLAQSDRLASLGTLAAGVAHEINNPLAYVLGNLDFVQAGLSEAREDAAALRQRGDSETGRLAARLDAKIEELAAMIENARDGGDRVRRIVADLKTFSRGDSDHPPAAVDVRKVMGSSINIARNEIRHRAQLVLDYRDVPLVAASESRIGQVFLNLLLNAAQAIPDGAVHRNRITIRTFTAESGRAVIEVSDTGSGIAPDVQARLFDPFFTTKKAGVGTGLGLAICHTIITGYQGDITVESEVGKGSTFRITLPPLEEEVVEPPPSSAVSSGPTPRGRVLIVDDEPFVAAVCRRMLAPDHDVEVVTAGGRGARADRGGGGLRRHPLRSHDAGDERNGALREAPGGLCGPRGAHRVPLGRGFQRGGARLPRARAQPVPRQALCPRPAAPHRARPRAGARSVIQLPPVTAAL
jgi:PAS domain S-box-containing protein